MKGEIIMTEKLTIYQKEIIDGRNFLKKELLELKKNNPELRVFLAKNFCEGIITDGKNIVGINLGNFPSFKSIEASFKYSSLKAGTGCAIEDIHGKKNSFPHFTMAEFKYCIYRGYILTYEYGAKFYENFEEYVNKTKTFIFNFEEL